MNGRFRSLALLALVLAAPTAGAQAINRAGTGLALPASTIGFETQTGGVAATTQYAGQGVTFGPGMAYNDFAFFSALGGGAMSLTNFGQGPCAGPCQSPVNIYFTNAVNGAAFYFITNGATSTFTALLAGNSVYSFSGTTDTNGQSTPEFYGFDSTISFDQIRIVPNGTNSEFALDNLQVGVVSTPEPASLSLLATGLFGMVGVARRRRNRAA